jgi:aminoglycoside phosphotransferase (APT) family kinase protein
MIDDLQSYFERKFPEWADIKVFNINDIASGWETEVISFDLRYFSQNKENNGHFVARIYPGNMGTHRAKFEYDLLNSLHTARYPVPRVFLVDTESEIFKRPFIIMQRIIGSTMVDRMLLENGSIDSKMADMFCSLFVQLHRLDWRRMTIVPERYLQSDSKSLFEENLDRWREHVMSHDVGVLSPIIDWLLANLRRIEFSPVSLLHKDFHPMNILMDQKGNPFVIDWTAATLGDPRIDVAWTLLLSRLHFGHGLHEIILDKYQRVAGANLSNMGFFTVDACLRRLSDILISLNAGAEFLGMRESTADKMRREIHMLGEMNDILERITGMRIEEITDQAKNYQAGP